jgi:hypothetical protein
MSRNSAGTYTLPLPPVVPGEFVEAEWANDTLDDIAQAMSDSLDRFGRGGMQAPFKFLDGDLLAPGITWQNEPTSGWTRSGLGIMLASILGEEALKITGTGITAKEFFTTAAPSSGSSLMSKDAVTAALLPYQLIATAWHTGNFDPATKQNVNTAWNTTNFNPALYALLNNNATFAALVGNGIRSLAGIRGTQIVATPTP